MSAGPSATLADDLERLYAEFRFDRSLEHDPLGTLRPFARDPRRAEVAGALGSVLAVGTTTSIQRAIATVTRAADGDLAAVVEPDHARAIARRLRGFRHRWIRGDQLVYLFGRLTALYQRGETLERVFATGFADGGFAGGLDRLARYLRSGPARAPAGYARLFPSPLDPTRSACKRSTLFVRWMVRDRYPDLGVWTTVPTGELRVPLDQHVFWIARNIGLTDRRTPSWAAVEDVTEALRRIDPIDPVRFDFVLCHTGVSKACPKRREIVRCAPCALRPDCRLWRRVRAA